MKLMALMKVRNEEWVLRASLEAALRWCDEALVMDHCSEDSTPAIVREAAEQHPHRVHVMQWCDREWTEASQRQAMLERGRQLGGTHFAVIDADEVLSGNLLESIRFHAQSLAPGQAAEAPWPAMWRSVRAYRDDESVWSRNFMTFLFRDGAGVTFAAAADGYDIHARRPAGTSGQIRRIVDEPAGGGLMHLQFANWRRLRAKHAWYKMTEATRWPGRQSAEALNFKYGRALDETNLVTATVPASWWEPYGGLEQAIDLNDEPWHERACREMWERHGAGAFAGLELWGVVGVGAERRAA